MRIFIFGDSIAQGFYDSQGGWVQRISAVYHSSTLQSMLDGKGLEYEVYNLGISGDTAEGVLNRMDNEIQARHLYDDEDMIVIATGTNDAILRDNRVINDEYIFEEVIEKLIRQALNYTSKVLLVGLPPVDQELTDPWKFSRSKKQWKNNRIDLFEDILKQVAHREGVAFVGIYDRLRSKMEQGATIHADGLHPNDLGHALIADLVRPSIQELAT